MPDLVKGKPGRVRQVFRWLKAAFHPPGGHKVRLRVVDEIPKAYLPCSGITVWNDKGDVTIWVRLSTISESLDILIHEYAHVLTCGRGEDDGHGYEFYSVYGELDRKFHYHGGATESKDY